MPLNDISLSCFHDLQRTGFISSTIPDPLRAAQIDELRKFFSQPHLNIDFKNDKGDTALHIAIRCREFAIAQALLEKGADPNSRDAEGNTPLILAVGANENGIIAKILLGIEIVKLEARNNVGRTALHEAARAGNYDVAKALLQRKVNVNLQDSAGDTALMIAVEYSSVEVAKLLLQYGAFRAIKNGLGNTVLDTIANLAEGREPSQQHFDILRLFGEIPHASGDEGISEAPVPRQLLSRNAAWTHSASIWWLFGQKPRGSVDSSKRCRFSEAVNFSPLPKDKLVDDIVIIVQDAEKVGEDRDSQPGSGRLWIHVPCNNILWIRWAIQHLSVSYNMTRGVNLFGIIDQAFAEVRQSPTPRRNHCMKSEDVISIVMPFLVVETESLITSRHNPSHAGATKAAVNLRSRLEVMQALDRDYGYDSQHEERRGVLQIPQTLDQSYFALDEPSTSLDTDQVMYRYTNKKNKSAKLLMVNQLWLWKAGDLILTAFLEPWTADSGNRSQPSCLLLDNPQRDTTIRVTGSLGMWVLHHCVMLGDHRFEGELEDPDTWESVFAESIAALRRKETDGYKAFSDYLSHSERNIDFKQSATDAKVLYAISSEIEGLREARDIRDELNMIKDVLSVQLSVLDGCKNLKVFGTLEVTRGIVTQKLDKLKELDKEAQDIERRFNELLDLKYKQGSLSLARDADKRDKQSERQSQLLFAFTVITVIFTPLNFVAAFMAIPTKEYPHTADNINWNWWQTFVGMLIAEIISVPTVYAWIKSTDLRKKKKMKKKPSPATQTANASAELDILKPEHKGSDSV